MKAAHYEDIGHYLKDVRESLNLSLSDAATAMHIRVHYLDAIETGKFEKLPGKAYVRGYIKNYASFLEIDPTETLAAYDELMGVVKQEFFIPEPTVKENLPSQTLLIVVIAGAVVLAGVYLFSGRDREHVTSVEDVPAEIRFATEGKKNPRLAEWEICLKSQEAECYNTLYPRYILLEIQEEYKRNFELYSGNE